MEDHLVLAPYLTNKIGIKKIKDLQNFRDIPEGFGTDGMSYMYHAIVSKGEYEIDGECLRKYDENIRRYIETISRNWGEPIRLKYFQYLSVLLTEIYLEEYFNGPIGLMNTLTDFSEKLERDIAYKESDVSKLAYWMATGAGKTLLMHINYLQMLAYNKGANKLDFENIMLITPNAGLTEQHEKEMKKSGIPSKKYMGERRGLFQTDDRKIVKIIEIHKLKLPEDKKGEGVSIDITELGTKNLIFVDEGHKGQKSEDKKWKRVRDELAKDGFTFEYSATFGQALAIPKSGKITGEIREYAKCIIIDYSYKYFHSDGYGKDFRIMNLESFEEEKMDNLLLGNAISFYEQKLIFDNLGPEAEEYNIEPPLWVFVGSKVNEDKSDVLKVVKFFSKLLQNKDNWAETTIARILKGDSGLKSPEGNDVFAPRKHEKIFPYLREKNIAPKDIVEGIYTKLLHLPDATSGRRLQIEDIKQGSGELGLKASGAEKYFGLINIGNEAEFKKLVKDEPDITVEKDVMTGAMFGDIDKTNSPITVLIGAKKFIEGWNCWRVSTMGLLNVGRGEGPQIIQLFGRGVRLKGKEFTLKRSSHVPPPHPNYIEILENLAIFGIRASYMDSFRKILKDEDLPVYTEVSVKTKVIEPFPSNLKIPRLKEGADFVRDERFDMTELEKILAKINLIPRVKVIDSTVEAPLVAQAREDSYKVIPEKYLNLLDWDSIYLELMEYRSERGWQNMAFSNDSLKQILYEKKYLLKALNERVVEPRSRDFNWITQNLKEVVILVLKNYLENTYNKRRKEWETENMLLADLEKEDRIILDEYQLKVESNSEKEMDKMEELEESGDLFTGACRDPIRNVFFEKHLFQPLLAMMDTGTIKTGSIGLNTYEEKFVNDLIRYLQTNPELLPEGSEVYLLRNQARGKGIGFYQSTTFYPDFILWIKKAGKQWIIFIDPKGLVFAGNLDNEKIMLFKTLREELQPKLGVSNIYLDSFIISNSPFETVHSQYKQFVDMPEYEKKRHILFQFKKKNRDNPDYVGRLFSISMNI